MLGWTSIVSFDIDRKIFRLSLCYMSKDSLTHLLTYVGCDWDISEKVREQKILEGYSERFIFESWQENCQALKTISS